jgi:hypothetical protein
MSPPSSGLISNPSKNSLAYYSKLNGRMVPWNIWRYISEDKILKQILCYETITL